MKSAVALLCALILAGCSSAPKPSTQIAAPSFDWSPPEAATANSADVSFGAVAGIFSDPEMGKSPFGKRFSTNLGQDLLELLTAKGFTVSGPFVAVNEMTYPEKKNADLILVPEVDIQPQVRVAPSAQHSLLMDVTGYKFNGESAMQGRITLVVMESLSGQRMWNKSIELPASTLPFRGQVTYPTEAPPAELANDPGLVAVQGAQLEAYYNDVLGKAWTYLNPEEMSQIKLAAQDVRSKTTFQGK